MLAFGVLVGNVEHRRYHGLILMGKPMTAVWVFNTVGAGDCSLPFALLTTHSPNIASVAPVSSIVVLRATKDAGTRGYSLASLDLTSGELEDLQRYLDANRGDVLRPSIDRVRPSMEFAYADREDSEAN